VLYLRSSFLRLNTSNSTNPVANGSMADGSGVLATSPLIENAMLNVCEPPTMSVPMRSQSGARFSSRVQACRSVNPEGNGVPGGAIGFGAESQKKLPSERSTCGTKK
jgi:hypothetical protein